MAREGIPAGLRGSKVRVEQRLDGTMAVRFRGRYLAIARCAAIDPTRPVPQPTPAEPQTGSNGQQRSRWMEGFQLRKSPPLWAVLRAERTPAPTPAKES